MEKRILCPREGCGATWIRVSLSGPHLAARCGERDHFIKFLSQDDPDDLQKLIDSPRVRMDSAALARVEERLLELRPEDEDMQ